MIPHLDTELLRAQSNALISQRKYSKASLKLKRALKHRPKAQDSIYTTIGVLQTFQKKYTKALQYYKKATLITPNYHSAHYNWAVALYEQDKFQEAYAHLSQFIPKDSIDPNAFYLLATVCLKLHLYREADDAFWKVVKLNPRYPGIYCLWASSQYYLGEFNGAKNYILKALRTDPNDSVAHRMLGYLFLMEQKYQEAIDCFKKALEVNPFEIMSPFIWSLALILQNKEKEGLKQFDKGCRLLDRRGGLSRKREILAGFKENLEFQKRYRGSKKNVQTSKMDLKASIKDLERIILRINEYYVEGEDYVLEPRWGVIFLWICLFLFCLFVYYYLFPLFK